MGQAIEAARDCQKALEEAQMRLTFAVTALHPIGKNVRVRLSSLPNHGATWGRVIGHGTGRFAGQVSLRLDTRTRLRRDFGWERLEL
jgi:hypothetical protein